MCFMNSFCWGCARCCVLLCSCVLFVFYCRLFFPHSDKNCSLDVATRTLTGGWWCFGGDERSGLYALNQRVIMIKCVIDSEDESA